MEMEGIITSCITSGIIILFAELIRDWRNKRNKDKLENKRTDYEAQKQGLDLVQEFYERVKQVTADQNKELFERLDKIEERLDKFEKLQQDMVTFLNGEFAEWQKNRH